MDKVLTNCIRQKEDSALYKVSVSSKWLYIVAGLTPSLSQKHMIQYVPFLPLERSVACALHHGSGCSWLSFGMQAACCAMHRRVPARKPRARAMDQGGSSSVHWLLRIVCLCCHQWRDLTWTPEVLDLVADHIDLVGEFSPRWDSSSHVASSEPASRSQRVQERAAQRQHACAW